MILEKHRKEIVILIDESHSSGARYKKACDVVGISLRTLQRWKRGKMEDRRKGSHKRVVRKLSPEEKEEIIKTSNNPRFRDMAPHQIVPLLLNDGHYIASERTFYRILKENKMINHRSNSAVTQKRSKPPERKANKSNQVWCWDITWLPQTVKGLFFYAYVIIDIFDRSIVGWAVHDSENEVHSADLFRTISKGKNISFDYLHSDNGHPMKGVTFMSLLEALKVTVSFSRPRVSNDNSYIESFFKTMKYDSKYPLRFDKLSDARSWMAEFINWYNTKHLHSSIGYVTPEQMRSGLAAKIFQKRNDVMKEAKSLNAERWGSRKPKFWSAPDVVILNSEKGV